MQSPARIRWSALTARVAALMRTAERQRAALTGDPLGWLRAWVAVPRGALARRLTLVGLAIALQNAIELPRAPAADMFGPAITSVLVVLALSLSLLCILAAARPQAPRWRWLDRRAVQALVLLATLAAVPIGIKQFATAATAGLRPPLYENDGTTLDHYAAMQLLEGHDPYVTTDIVNAIHLFHQVAEHTTPLRQGAFAAQPPADYPSKEQMRAVFAREPASQPAKVLAFESHLSYPALSFLPLVPLVWAGSPSVVPFFALCFLALVALLAAAVPPEARPWMVLLALADAPLFDAAVTGDLDLLYVLLLAVAWRWWRRPLLSTVMLGLALAAKQLAWFYVPFYALLVWRREGARAALARLAGAGAIFAAINAPFIVASPGAWLAGILAPQVDPMFPLGGGLIRLSLGGVAPLLPAQAYTILEALAIAGCIVWYWRHGDEQPEIGFVLAMLPLFVAWRSLTTYFYFVALPVLALVLSRALARTHPGGQAASHRAWAHPIAPPGRETA